MTVNEAVAQARLDVLIDRILSDPFEKVTDRDLAFRLCVLRRWVQRVGVDGPNVEFRTERAGRTVGWAFTARGRVVAAEELAKQDVP